MVCLPRIKVSAGVTLYWVLWSPMALLPCDFPTSLGNGNAGVGGVRIVLGGELYVAGQPKVVRSKPFSRGVRPYTNRVAPKFTSRMVVGVNTWFTPKTSSLL